MENKLAVRILYFKWGKTGVKVTKKAFKEALPFLTQEYTGVNLSLGDSLCPKDIEGYPYQTNYEDAGLSTYMIHHHTPNLLEELKIDPKIK